MAQGSVAVPALNALFGLFAQLLCLGLVFWLLLGRPARKRERDQEARRRGGRRARDRSIFGLPARDRSFDPRAILVLAAFTVAGVVLTAKASGQGSTPVTTALVLGAAVPTGFAIRPDIVGAGMGLVGIVTLVLVRLGARSCPETVRSVENVAWFVSAAVVVAAFLVVGGLTVPVQSGQRILRNVIRPFWTSPGSPGPPGRFGGMVLLVFGILELLDLVFRVGRPGQTPRLILGRRAVACLWPGDASSPPTTGR